MLIFFGSLYKVEDDCYVFQLKDHDRIQKFINNVALENEVISLSENDIRLETSYLCYNVEYSRWERVILKDYQNDILICERLDFYGNVHTTIDRLYKLPKCVCAIEAQLFRCKMINEIPKEYLAKIKQYPQRKQSNMTCLNDDLNYVTKVQVHHIDQQRVHYIDSISLVCKDNYRYTESLQYRTQISIPNADHEYTNCKDYGFDFDYAERSCTNNSVVSVPITSNCNIIKEKVTNKEQILKTKSQLAKKYMNEGKYRPYGVLYVDRLSRIRFSHNHKKLIVPKNIKLESAPEFFIRAIMKLGIQLDRYFCQLLCFDYIQMGYDVSIIGVVDSGLTTALALPLAYKLCNQLIRGLVQPTKLYLVVLVKNISNGKYLEKFFNTIFKQSVNKQERLKTVFINEIGADVTSSTDIITANIVIGSVSCVIDAIKNKFMVLTHLKYILVDDAHVILQGNIIQCQELFNLIQHSEDGTTIWDMIPSTTINSTQADLIKSESIGKQGDRKVQIILNSHKFNNEFNSFLSIFVPDTLLFITDPIEMLAYLPSTYSPRLGYHATMDDEKHHFFQYINDVLLKANLLVFTRTALETEMLYDECNSKGINVLRGTGFVDPGKIHDLNTIWCATRNASLHYVFIVSDCALSKLAVTDALYTYHYTLPLTKMDLRNRLGCSLNVFQVFVDTLPQSIDNLGYYMAVCPNYDCSNLIYCIKHITRTCDKSLIDNNVINLYKSKLYGKERDMIDKLCPSLKLYGMCSIDKVFCNNSHTPHIINQKNHIIHRGSVIFTVTSVRCCTHVCGIVERFFTGNDHLDEIVNGIISKNRIELLNDLSFDMQLDDNKKQITISPALLKDSKLYACKDLSGAFYRCKLIAPCKVNINLFTVHCVDMGVAKDVNKNDIFHLPEHFQSIKPLAYEFVYTNYLPSDIIYGWPNNLTMKVCDAIMGKTVHAHIVYGYENTIWINSLLQKSNLKNIKASVVNFSLGYFLKSVSYSQKSDQLNKFVNKLTYTYYGYKGRRSSLLDKICSKSSLHKSSLCELSSNYLHINIKDDDNSKENLDNQISAYVDEKSTTSYTSCQHYRIGELCLGKFLDGIWYRAEIIKFNELTKLKPFSTYDVYMIDIGEYCNELPLESLISIPYDHPILKKNDQAIRCSIIGADFNGLDGDQLDLVFDYFDTLRNNLYVQFDCDTHELESNSPTVHKVHCCYIIADDTSPLNMTYSNVLSDLYLDYNVMPTIDIINLLKEKYSLYDDFDPNQICIENWANFINIIKNGETAMRRESLKYILDQTLSHLSNNQNPEPSSLTNELADIVQHNIEKSSNSIIIIEEPICLQVPPIDDRVFIKTPPKCISWYETNEGIIKMCVLVKNPTDICCTISDNYFGLKYQDDNNGCDINLKLYKNVDPTTKIIKETGRHLYIEMKKFEALEWKRLFDYNAKLRWITYDFDKIDDNNTTTESNQNINSNGIDWDIFGGVDKKNNPINLRLPENDDHFELTSSELSELDGFDLDFDDHDI